MRSRLVRRNVDVFRDLSKRGSFKQQLAKQAGALKSEIAEMDRLAAAVRHKRTRHNPENSWARFWPLALAGGLLWLVGRQRASCATTPGHQQSQP